MRQNLFKTPKPTITANLGVLSRVACAQTYCCTTYLLTMTLPHREISRINVGPSQNVVRVGIARLATGWQHLGNFENVQLVGFRQCGIFVQQHTCCHVDVHINLVGLLQKVELQED